MPRPSGNQQHWFRRGGQHNRSQVEHSLHLPRLHGETKVESYRGCRCSLSLQCGVAQCPDHLLLAPEHHLAVGGTQSVGRKALQQNPDQVLLVVLPRRGNRRIHHIFCWFGKETLENFMALLNKTKEKVSFIKRKKIILKAPYSNLTKIFHGHKICTIIKIQGVFIKFIFKFKQIRKLLQKSAITEYFLKDNLKNFF